MNFVNLRLRYCKLLKVVMVVGIGPEKYCPCATNTATNKEEQEMHVFTKYKLKPRKRCMTSLQRIAHGNKSRKKVSNLDVFVQNHANKAHFLHDSKKTRRNTHTSAHTHTMYTHTHTYIQFVSRTTSLDHT